MTRAAILALLLAGCASAQPAPPAQPTWQLVTDDQGAAVFVWCGDSQLEWCPSVRRGDELGVLQPGGRIGFVGDVWDVRGKTVDAFSEVK